MTFPNTGPGEGPSPKESWHSTLASVRFRVKAVVSGVSPETTAADERRVLARQGERFCFPRRKRSSVERHSVLSRIVHSRSVALAGQTPALSAKEEASRAGEWRLRA